MIVLDDTVDIQKLVSLESLAIPRLPRFGVLRDLWSCKIFTSTAVYIPDVACRGF